MLQPVATQKLWIWLVIVLMNILISGTAFSFMVIPENCPRWFENSDVKPGIACVFNCVFIPTDNSSNTCSLSCPDLCERDFAGVAFFKIIDLYPGLTLAERGFATDSPRDAIIAYSYSWKAESICEQKYATSNHNDESDACRHFIWAALLTNRLGAGTAKKILDAHENNPDEATEERAMDMANNRAGILSCERLNENGTCNAETAMIEFQNELQAGRLIVLKPKRRGR